MDLFGFYDSADGFLGDQEVPDGADPEIVALYPELFDMSAPGTVGTGGGTGGKGRNAPPVQLLPSEEYGHRCTVHRNTEISLQCVKCQKRICFRCATGEHKAHALLCLKGYEILGEEQNIINIDVLCDQVSTAINNVGNTERKLVARFSADKTSVITWRDDIIAMVTERANQIIQELNVQLEEERLLCKEYEAELAARASVLRRIKNSGQSCVDSVMGGEILSTVEACGAVTGPGCCLSLPGQEEGTLREGTPARTEIGEAVCGTTAAEILTRHVPRSHTSRVHAGVQVSPGDLPPPHPTRLPPVYGAVPPRPAGVTHTTPRVTHPSRGTERRKSAFHTVGPQGENTTRVNGITDKQHKDNIEDSNKLHKDTNRITDTTHNNKGIGDNKTGTGDGQCYNNNVINAQKGQGSQEVKGHVSEVRGYSKDSEVSQTKGQVMQRFGPNPAQGAHKPEVLSRSSSIGSNLLSNGLSSSGLEVQRLHRSSSSGSSQGMLSRSSSTGTPPLPPSAVRCSTPPCSVQSPRGPSPRVPSPRVGVERRDSPRVPVERRGSWDDRMDPRFSRPGYTNGNHTQPLHHPLQQHQLQQQHQGSYPIQQGAIHGTQGPSPRDAHFYLYSPSGPTFPGQPAPPGLVMPPPSAVPPPGGVLQVRDRKRSLDEMSSPRSSITPPGVITGPPPGGSRPSTPGTPTYGPPPVSLLTHPSPGHTGQPSPGHTVQPSPVYPSPAPRVQSPRDFTASPEEGTTIPRPQPRPTPQHTLENKGIPMRSIETWEMTPEGERVHVYPLGIDLTQISVPSRDRDPCDPSPRYCHVSRVPVRAVVHSLLADPAHRQLLVRTSRGESPLSLYGYDGRPEGRLGEEDAYISATGGGIALDTRRGTLLMVQAPRSVYQFSSAGEYIGKINIHTAGDLAGIAYCSRDDLYAVTDSARGRIWLVHPDLGVPVSYIATFGSGPDQLCMPEFIDYDAGSDLIAVSDAGNDAVKLFDTSGTLRRVYGRDSTDLDTPAGVRFDEDGLLVVCDSGNQRVLRFWLDKHVERYEILLHGDQLENRVPWCVELTPEGLLALSTFSNSGKLAEYLDIFAPEYD